MSDRPPRTFKFPVEFKDACKSHGGDGRLWAWCCWRRDSLKAEGLKAIAAVSRVVDEAQGVLDGKIGMEALEGLSDAIIAPVIRPPAGSSADSRLAKDIAASEPSEASPPPSSPVPPVSRGERLTAAGWVLHDAVRKLFKAGKRRASEGEVVRWVWENALVPWEEIDPEDVPSPAAITSLVVVKNRGGLAEFNRTERSVVLKAALGVERPAIELDDDGRIRIAYLDRFIRGLADGGNGRQSDVSPLPMRAEGQAG